MIFSLEKAPASGEVAELQKLQNVGMGVAPTVVLDGLEAEFYELGNLAENIRRAFVGAIGARIDEAKLEAACGYAEKLLRESYMFPERSEAIKRVLAEGRFLVRYASAAPFALESGKQAALWAVKRLWASRWQFDAVMERIPDLAPPESATLIQLISGDLEEDPQLSRRAAPVLNREVKVWASQGAVVRIST